MISDGTNGPWKCYELMKVTKAERNPLLRPKGPLDVEAHLGRARKQRGTRPTSMYLSRVTSQRRQSGKIINRVTYQDGDTQAFPIQELYPYLDEEAHED